MTVFLLVWTVWNVPHNISIGFKCELWQDHSITLSLFVYTAFLGGFSNVLRINIQLKGPLLTQNSKPQAIPKDNISILSFSCLFFLFFFVIWKCFLFDCITFICRCSKTFKYMTVVGVELSNTSPIFCSAGNLIFICAWLHLMPPLKKLFHLFVWGAFFGLFYMSWMFDFHCSEWSMCAGWHRSAFHLDLLKEESFSPSFRG